MSAHFNRAKGCRTVVIKTTWNCRYLMIIKLKFVAFNSSSFNTFLNIMAFVIVSFNFPFNYRVFCCAHKLYHSTEGLAFGAPSPKRPVTQCIMSKRYNPNQSINLQIVLFSSHHTLEHLAFFWRRGFIQTNGRRVVCNFVYLARGFGANHNANVVDSAPHTSNTHSRSLSFLCRRFYP